MLFSILRRPLGLVLSGVALLSLAGVEASTVSVATPISTNSTIDLSVYGRNTATYLNGSYTLYWTAHLDKSPPYLEIALSVNTPGWIGFGFADPDSGGMEGSDIATVSVTSNTTHFITSITDRYALIHALPNEDIINNFNPIAGWQSPSKNQTIVVFSRNLDTNDTQDRVITGGSVNVVMAYSLDGSTTVSFHGPNCHAYAVEFFPDTTISQPSTNEQVYFWNYTNPATPITTNETRYVCTTFVFDPKLPDGSTPSGQIIEIGPVVDPNTTAWVHHYVVYGCTNTTKFQSMFNNPTECLTNGNPVQDVCPEMVFAWAVGSGPLVFPPNVGATFGDPTDPGSIKYLAIEIHYNNPLLQPVSIIDQSGLYFKYITTKRQYNSGTIQLGDPTVQADPMPFGSSSYLNQFTCPGECTSLWPNDITIFGSFLHAHEYGSQLVSTVTSNGVTTDLSRVDFYEFAFQHIAIVNVTVKRGDRINVHCVYDVSQNLFSSDPLHTNDTEVVFGLGSENEMCLNYVYYYPRFSNATTFGACGLVPPHKTLCNYGTVINVANPVVDGSSYADPSWVLVKKFGLNSTAAAALNSTESRSAAASMKAFSFDVWMALALGVVVALL